jgi:hypothetical protein
LDDGEIEFGSKVNPGEARGDETLEAAQGVGVDPEVAAPLVVVDFSEVLAASTEPPRSLISWSVARGDVVVEVVLLDPTDVDVLERSNQLILLVAANPSPTKNRLDTRMIIRLAKILRTFIQKW